MRVHAILFFCFFYILKRFMLHQWICAWKLKKKSIERWRKKWSRAVLKLAWEEEKKIYLPCPFLLERVWRRTRRTRAAGFFWICWSFRFCFSIRVLKGKLFHGINFPGMLELDVNVNYQRNIFLTSFILAFKKSKSNSENKINPILFLYHQKNKT